MGVENCLAVGCFRNHGCGQPTCDQHMSKKSFVKLDQYQKAYTCCVKCEDKVRCALWSNLLIPISVVLVLIILLVIVLVLYHTK